MGIENILLTTSDHMRAAVDCLQKDGRGIVMVIDDFHQLIGTITDGDIRRALLDGVGMEDSLRRVLDLKTRSQYSKPVTAIHGSKREEWFALMKRWEINQLPIVDNEGRVRDLIVLNELMVSPKIQPRAVIMAGGLGTRLSPLTDNTPKPMLPIGGRPLMEWIVGQLRASGIHHIHITTHHQAEKISNHFGEGKDFGVNINYISDQQQLGTAGSLGLMEPSNELLLIMNGDILTNVNFSSMVEYHRDHKADMTVAVRQYDVQVPYGVLECDGCEVKTMSEKPVFNFFVNAGIYLIEPGTHSYIPKNRRFDMTDLIQTLIQSQRKVVSFPVMEYWMDIGQHADYEKAQEDVVSGRIKS